MKKLIVSTICALTAAGAAFAQGNVNWTGPSAAAFTAQTNTSTYFGGGAVSAGQGIVGVGQVGNTQGNAAAGTGYYYELLIGSAWNGAGAAVPTTLNAFSSWSDSGLGATNNPALASAGRAIVMSANSGTTVAGMSQTVSNSIIIVGWSANLGTTWSTALADAKSGTWTGNAFLGVSNEGWIQAFGTSTVPGATLFSNTAQTYGTPIFSLNTPLYVLPTPEPTTMALVGLGGAAMLMIRRKK